MGIREYGSQDELDAAFDALEESYQRYSSLLEDLDRAYYLLCEAEETGIDVVEAQAEYDTAETAVDLFRERHPDIIRGC